MISDPNFTIIGTAESAVEGALSLKAHSGGVKCPGQVAPTTGLKLWFPQTQRGAFNIFEPKQVDSLLYTMIGFFNHGTQGTATGS